MQLVCKHLCFPNAPHNTLARRYGCLDAVPPADAATLFAAATRYGLPGLRAECLRVLCEITSLETVATHVLLAYEQVCVCGGGRG